MCEVTDINMADIQSHQIQNESNSGNDPLGLFWHIFRINWIDKCKATCTILSETLNDVFPIPTFLEDR